MYWPHASTRAVQLDETLQLLKGIMNFNVERCMKKLELELQKILRNDIELTVSELTYFSELTHKGSQAKWQRRENSQARQLAGTCTYLQTKCFHTLYVYHRLGTNISKSVYFENHSQLGFIRNP